MTEGLKVKAMAQPKVTCPEHGTTEAFISFDFIPDAKYCYECIESFLSKNIPRSLVHKEKEEVDG